MRMSVLSMEVLNKRMEELRTKGYKLRQEIVLCDRTIKYTDVIKNELKSIGIQMKYIKYNISCIKMYFYTLTKAKLFEIRVIDGSVKYKIEDIVFFNSLTTDKNILVFLGEKVYDINNYRLLSSYPVLNKILKKHHLLLSSMCLWNMFNSYEYKSSAGYYEEDTLGQLSLGFLPKVVSDLKSNNMFLFKEGDTRVYKSDTGDVTVKVLVEDSIKLVYSDVYSCSYESEITEEVGIDIVKNPILLSRVIEGGKGYCIFKYSTMNFEELLRQLRLYKYKFVLFGFCGIRLLETCCVVCGFRRGSDYVYVSFYYNENGREFLIKVETKSTELQKIKINNASVTLIKVSVDSMDSVSTLINGFDLENFKENNLV